METPLLKRIRVWDLPTRVFHWALALSMVSLVVTAKFGGSLMVWHYRLGMLVLSLIAFRVLWGLLGGRWSRFASFIYAPATIWRYLRGRTRPTEYLEVGHDPVGSLLIFALLGGACLQLATGLVADDEIANQGPLNRFVSSGVAQWATSWHKTWGQWLLMALVALHVAAIFYFVSKKRQNLVGSMVKGDKTLPAGTPVSADGLAQRALGLLLWLACLAAAVWVFSLGA